mmetsp:Transcript_105669/g.252013  ORF Transcript_105669/g.252013 Transcript_105669/m.252013 type:complete len:136 (+) Transcript_105669:58-465(+)
MPIRAEDHITWGGSVLPRIDTLDPRIRGVALERFYLPKLVENGYSADPAIGRIIAAAGLKPRRQKALPSHSKASMHRSSSVPSQVPSRSETRRSSQAFIYNAPGMPQSSNSGAFIAGPRQQWGPVARMFAERTVH